ncbi:MAG: DNA cytosine methyltransferase [Anaerobacillus sp.]|uniref:DNA cytosine methyltransferase n=1 Tax=Anaerobacillus sp. TaxID=1872506 RepID=UPI00391C4C87
MIFKKGELFCGPGGLSLGAKKAKIEHNNELYMVEHVWANDMDTDSCSTFIKNICPDSPNSVICSKVEELEIESLESIDAFSFGFPCNDYSIVGESKGLDGKYGPLYSYGIKVLRHHQPKWFIAENVGGLQSANEGQAFIKIMQEMKEVGYRITPHLYKFEEYGIPQARHRIIIVGIHEDLGWEFKVPKAPFKARELWTTAKQALENPPIPIDAKNNEFTRHSAKVIQFLSEIPAGKNAWFEGIPEDLRLNVKGAKMSNIYKRLDPDLPAYTVTAKGGGGTHMYHYDEYRALTNRERARLQTFPDDFEFVGGKESVRSQVGMAVPVEGAKIIIEAILKSFAGVEYETESAKWEDELSEMIETGKRVKRKKTKQS